MMKNFISDGNVTLRIICEEKILKLLQKEFESYYSFSDETMKVLFDIYIYVDKDKFNNVLKIIKNIKNDIICIRDRNGIILINNRKKEIIIFYPELTDNNIQLIGEIVISLFGMMLENKGYIFIHAACVEKNKKGICILGARRTGKTTILSTLLQNQFNFVCNSQLGIKDIKQKIKAIGLPTRIGMRVETLELLADEDIKQRIIQNSDIKNRFGEDIDKNLINYKTKKFNIKVNELKRIYEIELKNNALIKIIIVPIYNPGIKHIQIKELKDEEIINLIYENKRSGAYGSAKYINSIFPERKSNVNINLKNIEAYMISYNEMNIDEVVKFLNSRLENMEI